MWAVIENSLSILMQKCVLCALVYNEFVMEI
jgi:hypothetical protein